MPAAIPDHVRAAILEDVKARAGSTREIAAKHGVSDFSVRKIAKDSGIEDAFSREATQKATAAKLADFRERMAKAAIRNLGVHEAILDSFEGLSREEWRRDVTPHTRGILLGITADKAQALAPPDMTALNEGKSLLGELLGALQAKHGTSDAAQP